MAADMPLYTDQRALNAPEHSDGTLNVANVAVASVCIGPTLRKTLETFFPNTAVDELCNASNLEKAILERIRACPDVSLTTVVCGQEATFALRPRGVVSDLPPLPSGTVGDLCYHIKKIANNIRRNTRQDVSVTVKIQLAGENTSNTYRFDPEPGVCNVTSTRLGVAESLVQGAGLYWRRAINEGGLVSAAATSGPVERPSSVNVEATLAWPSPDGAEASAFGVSVKLSFCVWKNSPEERQQSLSLLPSKLEVNELSFVSDIEFADVWSRILRFYKYTTLPISFWHPLNFLMVSDSLDFHRKPSDTAISRIVAWLSEVHTRRSGQCVCFISVDQKLLRFLVDACGKVLGLPVHIAGLEALPTVGGVIQSAQTSSEVSNSALSATLQETSETTSPPMLASLSAILLSCNDSAELFVARFVADISTETAFAATTPRRHGSMMMDDAIPGVPLKRFSISPKAVIHLNDYGIQERLQSAARNIHADVFELPLSQRLQLASDVAAEALSVGYDHHACSDIAASFTHDATHTAACVQPGYVVADMSADEAVVLHCESEQNSVRKVKINVITPLTVAALGLVVADACGMDYVRVLPDVDEIASGGTSREAFIARLLAVQQELSYCKGCVVVDIASITSTYDVDLRMMVSYCNQILRNSQFSPTTTIFATSDSALAKAALKELMFTLRGFAFVPLCVGAPLCYKVPTGSSRLIMREVMASDIPNTTPSISTSRMIACGKLLPGYVCLFEDRSSYASVGVGVKLPRSLHSATATAADRNELVGYAVYIPSLQQLVLDGAKPLQLPNRSILSTQGDRFGILLRNERCSIVRQDPCTLQLHHVVDLAGSWKGPCEIAVAVEHVDTIIDIVDSYKVSSFEQVAQLKDYRFRLTESHRRAILMDNGLTVALPVDEQTEAQTVCSAYEAKQGQLHKVSWNVTRGAEVTVGFVLQGVPGSTNPIGGGSNQYAVKLSKNSTKLTAITQGTPVETLLETQWPEEGDTLKISFLVDRTQGDSPLNGSVSILVETASKSDRAPLFQRLLRETDTVTFAATLGDAGQAISISAGSITKNEYDTLLGLNSDTIQNVGISPSPSQGLKVYTPDLRTFTSLVADRVVIPGSTLLPPNSGAHEMGFAIEKDGTSRNLQFGLIPDANTGSHDFAVGVELAENSAKLLGGFNFATNAWTTSWVMSLASYEYNYVLLKVDRDNGVISLALQQRLDGDTRSTVWDGVVGYFTPSAVQLRPIVAMSSKGAVIRFDPWKVGTLQPVLAATQHLVIRPRIIPNGQLSKRIITTSDYLTAVKHGPGWATVASRPSIIAPSLVPAAKVYTFVFPRINAANQVIVGLLHNAHALDTGVSTPLYLGQNGNSFGYHIGEKSLYRNGQKFPVQGWEEAAQPSDDAAHLTVSLEVHTRQQYPGSECCLVKVRVKQNGRSWFVVFGGNLLTATVAYSPAVSLFHPGDTVSYAGEQNISSGWPVKDACPLFIEPTFITDDGANIETLVDGTTLCARQRFGRGKASFTAMQVDLKSPSSPLQIGFASMRPDEFPTTPNFGEVSMFDVQTYTASAARSVSTASVPSAAATAGDAPASMQFDVRAPPTEPVTSKSALLIFHPDLEYVVVAIFVNGEVVFCRQVFHGMDPALECVPVLVVPTKGTVLTMADPSPGVRALTEGNHIPPDGVRLPSARFVITKGVNAMASKSSQLIIALREAAMSCFTPTISEFSEAGPRVSIIAFKIKSTTRDCIIGLRTAETPELYTIGSDLRSIGIQLNNGFIVYNNRTSDSTDFVPRPPAGEECTVFLACDASRGGNRVVFGFLGADGGIGGCRVIAHSVFTPEHSAIQFGVTLRHAKDSVEIVPTTVQIPPLPPATSIFAIPPPLQGVTCYSDDRRTLEHACDVPVVHKVLPPLAVGLTSAHRKALRFSIQVPQCTSAILACCSDAAATEIVARGNLEGVFQSLNLLTGEVISPDAPAPARWPATESVAGSGRLDVLVLVDLVSLDISQSRYTVSIGHYRGGELQWVGRAFALPEADAYTLVLSVNGRKSLVTLTEGTIPFRTLVEWSGRQAGADRSLYNALWIDALGSHDAAAPQEVVAQRLVDRGVVCAAFEQLCTEMAAVNPAERNRHHLQLLETCVNPLVNAIENFPLPVGGDVAAHHTHMALLCLTLYRILSVLGRPEGLTATEPRTVYGVERSRLGDLVATVMQLLPRYLVAGLSVEPFAIQNTADLLNYLAEEDNATAVTVAVFNNAAVGDINRLIRGDLNDRAYSVLFSVLYPTIRGLAR